jgi:membrane-associated phospholipid phosphatase
MEILTGYVLFHWIATWANPFCDIVFRAATDLGYHTFYYLVLAPLFWVVDRRRASILFLLIIASGFLNTVAKLWVHTPRPDPHLARVLDLRPYRTGSNAFPSGHAQNAVVFWTYLAWWVGRRWFSAVAAVMVALISFSRLYLAVHFPIDIIGGLALGVVLMLLLPPVLERWSRAGFHLSRAASIAAAASSLALAVPVTDLTLALIGGSFIGFMAGAVWLPQSPWVFRSPAQMSAMVAGGLVLLVGLSVAFDSFPTTVPVFLYVRIAVLWIVAFWLYPQALHRISGMQPVPVRCD